MKVVPETFHGALRNGRAAEPIPKVVEKSKFVTAEDVAVGLCLYLVPELPNGGLENGTRMGIDVTVIAVPSLLQRSSNGVSIRTRHCICHHDT